MLFKNELQSALYAQPKEKFSSFIYTHQYDMVSYYKSKVKRHRWKNIGLVPTIRTLINMIWDILIDQK
jgi:hypothetical protein